MKRLWTVIGCGLLLCIGTVGTAAEIRLTDDLGREIRLEQPASRIVSLSPHSTELLFAAGAGDRVVGAVSYSDYPSEAEKIPRVGGFKSLDFERILALRPDLVVGWHSGNGPQALQRLRSLGLTVYESEPKTLLDIPRTIENLGTLAGTRPAADENAAGFRRHYDELEQRYRRQRPVATFYQIWNRPLMTINGDHVISQVIELCGGRNVFADLGPLAATIDVEAVLKAQPEAIVASGMGEERPDWLDDWRRWEQLPAVRQGNLFFIPPSIIQRQGPRILQGARILCEQLEEARG